MNAYVDEPRMTQDIDVLSNRASELAAELREFLHVQFRVSIRVRKVKDGLGYRLYQVRKPKHRHLVHVRQVDQLPPVKRLSDVLVMTPEVLVASKVIALHARRGKPKAGTDWRDLAVLLLTFPELKKHPGPVSERLTALDVGDATMKTWEALVSQDMTPDDEDLGY